MGVRQRAVPADHVGHDGVDLERADGVTVGRSEREPLRADGPQLPVGRLAGPWLRLDDRLAASGDRLRQRLRLVVRSDDLVGTPTDRRLGVDTDELRQRLVPPRDRPLTVDDTDRVRKRLDDLREQVFEEVTLPTERLSALPVSNGLW